MEADFSGYATKAGLKCSDGRTIMPEAFKHMDGKKVPLVWQHGHNDPGNVLGHAILEGRPDGVYAYAYFNENAGGKNAKALVQHGDITALSIYANQLVERAKSVFHGTIREVSLVLSGANPGALIDNISIAHGDGDLDLLEDEAIIYTGLTLEHEDRGSEESENADATAQEVYDSFTDVQTDVVHGMIEAALEAANGEEGSTVEHAAADATLQDVYDSFTEEQKTVVHYMIGTALEAASSKTAAHADTTDEGDLNHTEGTDDMTNVFEKNGSTGGAKNVLSHADIKGIVTFAQKNGSLKDAVEDYALQHGIENIGDLFPDATSVTNTPEFDKRRTEWVAGVISGTRHTPFSRIKSLSADLTFDAARAKGYIKGNMKKEEFFGVGKRVTTPTTIYKRQKLDRDDVIDITDFDVVAWLRFEMRFMLDEELARAVLVGDGRDVDDPDKINETNIRPISKDAELYATTAYVNVDDADSNWNEVVESVLLSRRYYKGSGMPNFYTTEDTLTRMLLSKDNYGRRFYNNESELALALRVGAVIAVPVMEEEPDLLGIVVNLYDYTLGADKGGEVNLFDDFDIDYNQYKYMIETRVSGALTKIKAALIIRKTAGTNVLVAPVQPVFDDATNTITIPTVTGMTYEIGGAAQIAGPVVIAVDTVVDAIPAAGYYFANTAEDSWTFVYTA